MEVGVPPGASAARAKPLRTLAAGLLEALRTRLDLAAVEFEIHLLVLLRVLICLLGALACAMLALTFAVAALILALWERHRLLGVLGATGICSALALLFGALAARTLYRQPPVLDGSLRELKQDERQVGGAA